MLEGKPPTETRERVKALLDRRRAWSGDRLRWLRVIQVVGGVGMPETRAVLKILAEGRRPAG